jgi:pilus assembly protein CpaC
MHRTQRMSRTAVGFLLLLLTGGGLAAVRAAEDGPQAPGGEGQAGPKVVTIRPSPIHPGSRTILVPISATVPLQMSGKKEIKSAVNPKESVLIVTPKEGDPTTVLLNGRETGTTQVTLTATDGTVETYSILVQLDLEYGRLLLQQAVPTASLQLIPAGGNTLIISGTVNNAEDIDIIMRTAQSVMGSADRVVNAMRVAGVQQVQLDAVIAFVSRSELRRMSFDFLDAGLHHNLSSTVGGALQNPALGSTLSSVPGIAIPVTNAVGAPNGAPANFFLGLFNDKQVFYGLLQALRNENLAKILAEPKLVTLSGRSAQLLSGGQQAIPETAGLGSVSVRFEPFGTSLSVLPIVLGNGKIQLEVEPQVSNIDPTVGTSIAGTVVPGRNTQSVHTTVIIEDGQTLAIGGLIQNTVTGVDQKVPILGDLPYIGAAFRSMDYMEVEQELVVMVTPHLVDPMACNQVPKHLPGQETRSPDDYELFLEGILEAPRGPRLVCDGLHYTPAYKNDPTASIYPCAGGHCQGNGAGCCNGGPAGCAVSGPAVGYGTDGHAKPLAGATGDVSHVADQSVPAPAPATGVLPPTEADKLATGPAKIPAADKSGKSAKPFALPSLSGRAKPVDAPPAKGVPDPE